MGDNNPGINQPANILEDEELSLIIISLLIEQGFITNLGGQYTSSLGMAALQQLPDLFANIPILSNDNETIATTLRLIRNLLETRLSQIAHTHNHQIPLIKFTAEDRANYPNIITGLEAGDLDRKATGLSIITAIILLTTLSLNDPNCTEEWLNYAYGTLVGIRTVDYYIAENQPKSEYDELRAKLQESLKFKDNRGLLKFDLIALLAIINIANFISYATLPPTNNPDKNVNRIGAAFFITFMSICFAAILYYILQEIFTGGPKIRHQLDAIGTDGENLPDIEINFALESKPFVNHLLTIIRQINNTHPEPQADANQNNNTGVVIFRPARSFLNHGSVINAADLRTNLTELLGRVAYAQAGKTRNVNNNENTHYMYQKPHSVNTDLRRRGSIDNESSSSNTNSNNNNNNNRNSAKKRN